MTGRVVVLEFMIPAPWINANERKHWRVLRERARFWRAATSTYARSQRVPAFERAHVLAELCFTDRRRRDPDNFSLKAAIDGLVDAGVLPDDDSTHLLGPDNRIGPVVPRISPGVPGTPRVRLTITELLDPMPIPTPGETR